MASKPKSRFLPLSPERWNDIEHLFGPRGACAGCWCMWWRIKRSEFEKQAGAANKRSFRKLVRDGSVPGLIAYRDGEPVGWCAVEPREAYPVLARSHVLKPVDERPVWSVTCFFIARAQRGTDLTVELLGAAARHARKHGARILEGYPVEPRSDRLPDFSAFTGLPSAYERAGFAEVARRSRSRPIMRLALRGARRGSPHSKKGTL